MTREEVIATTAHSIQEKLPPLFDVEAVSMAYPVSYHESMNTVLVQEVIRYNSLLEVIHKTLPELQKALKGLVVMSSELEEMSNSLFNDQIPTIWVDRVNISHFHIQFIRGKICTIFSD